VCPCIVVFPPIPSHIYESLGDHGESASSRYERAARADLNRHHSNSDRIGLDWIGGKCSKVCAC